MKSYTRFQQATNDDTNTSVHILCKSTGIKTTKPREVRKFNRSWDGKNTRWKFEKAHKIQRARSAKWERNHCE